MKVQFVSYYLTRRRGSTPAVLGMLLETLVNINYLYLKEFPQTPRIYQSGIKYQPEKYGAEDFKDIGQLLEEAKQTGDLVGDCEDLAAWRVAEARAMDGLGPNEAFIEWIEAVFDGATVYHIRANIKGVREDVSKIVGRKQ